MCNFTIPVLTCVSYWWDRAVAQHWAPLEKFGFSAVLRNTQFLFTIFVSPSIP